MSLTRTLTLLSITTIVVFFLGLVFTTPAHAVGIPAGTNLTVSGPITISGESNITISGKKITNPDGNCIEILNGSTNIVIENSEIGPCGKEGVETDGFGIMIKTESNNITVRNNYFHETHNTAVHAGQFTHHVTVDNNVMVNVWTGFRVYTRTSKGYFIFTNNFVKNLGWNVVGLGQDIDGPRGVNNVVQLIYARNSPGIRITDNIAINEPGKSTTEDLVSIWTSGGTEESPILVARNRFKGGGPSKSSAGIQTEDGEGTGNVIVEDNIYVNPPSIGMGCGGDDVICRNNKIFSPNDPTRDFTNVGMGVWNHLQNGVCPDMTIENNEVTFWQAAGLYTSNAFLNPYWKSGDCPVNGFSTNTFDTDSTKPPTLTADIWDPAWDTPDGAGVDLTPRVCNKYGPQVAVPSGYGASYNVFNTAEMMVSVYCKEETSLTVTSGNNDPLTYIYNQGYRYDAGAGNWVNFTYSCSNLIADAWCVGQVEKTLTTPTTGTNFLVSYTCQWSGTKWNCGCSNTSCSTHAWQLQAYGF